MKKGFTLVEVGVAVAIVAVLTVIVSSNFSSTKTKSANTKKISDTVQMQLALRLFFEKCGGYPNSLATTTTISTCPSGVNLGTFIDSIPAGFTYSLIIAPDYILRTTLSKYDNVLRDDIDGYIGGVSFGVPCDDSPNYYYCVSSK